jgi:ClpP class serine protease
MSMRAYSRAAITQRLFNTPLQVMPETASIVLGAIGERFDVAQLFVAAEGRTIALAELEEGAATARVEIEARAGTDQVAPFAPASNLMRVVSGVGFVEIRGELVAENGIGPMSGFTGYDGIRAQVLAADADDNVKGIVLDIDSPGGEVAGLYELTKVLMARRGAKPTRAVIRGIGASAACAVAVCADPGEITIHPLGIGGSVGTIAMHADFSGKLAKDGVKVTLIAAGDHKVDGNPFEPLPEDVRDRIAQMVTSANDRFIAHVAEARGLTEDAVRSQQALTYRGEEAVAAGLADKVMSWADSIDEFTAKVNGSGTQTGGGEDFDEGGAAPPAPGARSSQETKMKDPEFTQATQEAAVATARTEAVAAERQRIGQLIKVDAESNVSSALTAAIEEGTSAGDYAIQLACASKEQQAAALQGARSDAVKPDKVPDKRADAAASTAAPNRGEAAVARLRGRHQGLPAAG